MDRKLYSSGSRVRLSEMRYNWLYDLGTIGLDISFYGLVNSQIYQVV